MLESRIERNACKKILDELGVANVKLVTPGKTGYPDRMFLLPGGKPLLVEFKQPGEKPEPKQAHIHALLKQLGYLVETHDSVDGAIAAVRRVLEK